MSPNGAARIVSMWLWRQQRRGWLECCIAGVLVYPTEAYHTVLQRSHAGDGNEAAVVGLRRVAEVPTVVGGRVELL